MCKSRKNCGPTNIVIEQARLQTLQARKFIMNILPFPAN